MRRRPDATFRLPAAALPRRPDRSGNNGPSQYLSFLAPLLAGWLFFVSGQERRRWKLPLLYAAGVIVMLAPASIYQRLADRDPGAGDFPRRDKPLRRQHAGRERACIIRPKG